MNVDKAVEQILEPYMVRVQVKPGNGLSKSMNQSLRSYEQIPDIIRRTVALLAGTESLFGFSGVVRMRTQDLYCTLMDIHDDWVKELPLLGRRSPNQAIVDILMEVADPGETVLEERGTLDFIRRPLLPLHQFSFAWTIARRIGVIEGRGEIGLSRMVLVELRRLQGQVPSETS